ncbi:MAG: tripartite tricarboxylate transporter substrate binding protein [Pirellulales bacterium]
MDTLARLVAPKLAEDLGRPVIVENKPGAGGVIASDFVAKGPADGNTLLVTATGFAINSTMSRNLPYDTLKDFAAVANAVSAPQVLVVHRSVPANTVTELVDYARANPGFAFASIGAGSLSHLTLEMFKSASKVNIIHVPYKGATPAVADLLAGHVKAGFFVGANVMPYVKSGQLKALASTGRTRSASAPTVPTMVESGFHNFDVVAWIGFMVKAGTPEQKIHSLNQQILSALDSKDVRDRLLADGFEVRGTTPEEFATMFRSEVNRWGTIVRSIGAVGSN